MMSAKKRLIAVLAAVSLAFGVSVSPSLAFPVLKELSAVELLDTLQVKAETASGTYNRSLFKHWIDADGDGCDTRDEVLQEESTKKISCRLSGGSWISAYDGLKTTKPSTLDIDHFVPLKEAWESGAFAWDNETRQRFANDLDYSMSLIAVSAKTNRSKSDRDPASWLPPSTSFVCQYVGRWVAVKYRWSLAIDPAEKKVLSNKLGTCGSKATVAIPNLATIAVGVIATPSPSASATPKPSAIPSVSSTPLASATPQPSATTKALDPKFASCAEAKRNGYNRSYVKGVDPEYYYYRDGDADGVVCE
jgi:hypothetical protein